ncbi:biopolymer transporter TonB [Planctomycetota bacterium]|nr:biopolymer transporter TonB [Planctomycetota bacterium]
MRPATIGNKKTLLIPLGVVASWRFVLLLLVGLASVVSAGEPAAAAAPSASAEAARVAAETSLAEARAAITAERVTLSRDLQTALAAAEAARERLSGAERRRALADAEWLRRQSDARKSASQVAAVVDRATVAARLGESERRKLSDQPPLERLEAAIAAVERRLAALPAKLERQQSDLTIIARDGALVSAPVLRLGEARAVALGGEARSSGLLARTIDGGWRVTGPVLPKNAGIPLDPDGRAANRSEPPAFSLVHWIKAGRFFIWPILAVLAIGLGIAVIRAIDLIRRGVSPRRLLTIASLATTDPGGAAAQVAAGSTPLDRILRVGLEARDRPREAREAAVEQVLIAEGGKLHRGLPALLVLAGIAPLLGLLGTVTGMIDLFSVIAAEGSGNAKSLSGGISEALITTQAGMIVAIPLLVVHALLHRAAQRREQLLEEAACAVLGLVEQGRRA